MAQILSKNSMPITVVLFAACLILSGCRCAGFYSPVYSQKQVQELLQKNTEELSTFATGWLRDHRDDDMKFEECHGGKVTLARYARNGTGMAAHPAVTPNEQEIADLQHFAKRLKIEDVSVFRESNETRSWYLQMSFQGGAKWPYGLLYIPDSEPLNLLNNANGGPGPGFSKVIPLQGRWLYFESRN
jgi:hypothetical protein